MTLDPQDGDGAISGAAVAEAIARLSATGRGLRALAAFRRILEAGATALEPEGWAALETLCRACADGAAEAVFDNLPSR